MRHEALARFRHRLLAERSALLERWRQALSDEHELFEAGAPEGWDVETVAAAAVLSSIDAQGRRALARIQSLLARIDRDSYDDCAGCRQPIAEQTLRAAPDPDLGGRCAPRLN